MLRLLTATLAVLVVAIGATTVSEAPPDTKEVELLQGVVEGTRESIENGSSRFFYSFKGIPYAAPPVGDLRFENPEPAARWDGVRKSITPPSCVQPNLVALLQSKIEFLGEEDCLYLNVYTPAGFEIQSLPVMVFIHGGGFLIGNAEQQGGGPVPLLKRDIVLVSIQYRLGTFGFMSTGDSALPGNFGLKDQTFALEWVQKNIHKFGGNPKKVTIFGESAGSASVHFNILSPYSKGLFHRAIMQSGTALNPWSFADDHGERALNAARRLGCPGTEDSAIDTQQIAQCMKEQSVEDLASVAHWNPPAPLTFVMLPRVDGDYIPAHPAQLLKDGEYNKVDIMAGICQNEGGTQVKSILGNETVSNNLADTFDEVIPPIVYWHNEDNASYLTRRTAYHYVGDIKFTKEMATDYEKFFSDASFNEGYDASTSLHGRDVTFGKRTYRYELQHRPEFSFIDLFDAHNVSFPGDDKWVGHGDDYQYLFFGVFGLPAPSRDDTIFLSDIMISLWTNFAETGNPTPDLSLAFKWEPMASEDDLRYLSLTPAPRMKEDSRAENREFWRDMPLKKNKILYPERFTCSVNSC